MSIFIKSKHLHYFLLEMPSIPTMEWDYANQLHKAGSGTTTSFYNYDAGGNRVRKVVGKQDGTKEVRIYIGNFELYRKFDSNEDLVAERKTVFVTDGDKRIATIDTLTIDNKLAVSTLVDIIRYQYDNHLGSASLEMDDNANIISYEEYHPFGTSAYRLHRNDTEANLKRYRYVGKERDEETGLYYYGARYYASWLGRFISTDPMKEERIWVTPYSYCQSNPVNKIDPTGALDENPPENLAIVQKVKKLQAGIDIGVKTAENELGKVDEFGECKAACSTGVRNAFKDITGDNQLDDKTANQISEHIKNSKDFKEIKFSEVQGLANSGVVVIGYRLGDFTTNEKGERVRDSGHIVMAAPGKEEFSKSWNQKVPVVMDTGTNRRERKIKVSFSWSSSQKDEVTWVKYLGGKEETQKTTSKPRPTKKTHQWTRTIWGGLKLVQK